MPDGRAMPSLRRPIGMSRSGRQARYKSHSVLVAASPIPAVSSLEVYPTPARTHRRIPARLRLRAGVEQTYTNPVIGRSDVSTAGNRAHPSFRPTTHGQALGQTRQPGGKARAIIRTAVIRKFTPPTDFFVKYMRQLNYRQYQRCLQPA